MVESGADLQLFNCLLACYHYLGDRNSGPSAIWHAIARPAAGLALFGSAAWKCAARDAFIGWERRGGNTTSRA